MELTINIEKVVINLNEPNNNLNGLINTKDAVDKINKLSNEELSKRGVGVCSSPRMPSYMHYLVDVDNTVLSKCEDKVCFYDFEKEIFSNGADYAKDVFIECFESKSKEILKHLVETPMSHASLRVIYFECFDEKGINRKYLIECEITSKK